MKAVKFSPAKAEIMRVLEEVKSIKINGLDDEKGYKLTKEAKNKLAKYRIAIKKYGKQQREEAIAWQREVLRQEKELLSLIEPKENEFKTQLEEWERAKKREERKVLLPTRRAMLKEVAVEISDDEILDMDEKEFGEFYTAKKLEYMEKQKREEEERKREEEMERIKKEAEERARMEERRRIEEEKRKAEEAERKMRREKEVMDWVKSLVKKHKLKKGEYRIIREGDFFVLYKIIGKKKYEKED